MRKHILTATAALTILGMIGAASIALAQQSWTYRCPKCTVTLTYSTPQGIPKCPNDGTGMFLQR